MSKPVRPGVEALDLEKMDNYFSGQNLTFLKKKKKKPDIQPELSIVWYSSSKISTKRLNLDNSLFLYLTQCLTIKNQFLISSEKITKMFEKFSLFVSFVII